MKFYYDKRQVKSRTTRLFSISLWMASASIVLNGLCLYTIEHFEDVPFVLQMLLNSAYYLVCVFVSVMVAAYTINIMLAHVYEDKWRRRMQIELTILGVAYTLLIFANLWTGWVFWFNVAGEYFRGPLNAMGYVVMFLEIVMVGRCYFAFRDSVEEKVKQVVFTLAPIILLLAVFQRLFPSLLFNGTMTMVILLVFFVNFQNAQAEQDGITGAGDSRSFFDELDQRLSRGQKFQLIVVTLKQFSLVNQRYGRDKGDEILYQMCSWLEKSRKEARAFRFRNVTFALVCPYFSEMDTDSLLDRIRRRFDSPWVLGSIKATAPACYVRMVCDEPDQSAGQILELLSFMIDQAKVREDRLVIYNEEIRRCYDEEKDTDRLLQDAITKERFEVWYQPVYNCHTGVFDSAEALVRLRDDQGKIVSPGLYIPLAEKNGMIQDIGWQVWKQVCRFIRDNPEMTMSISVNLSAQQFNNPREWRQLEDFMNLCRVSPARLKLEITERVIMQDEQYMNKVMKELSAKGFRFCVDDFGIGYSNLASVMNFPFEIIKLDRSLIIQMDEDPVNRQSVQCLVDMFHNMGMSIVAEGVETEEEKDMIHQMGVEHIQGFYYARPMPARETLKFLAQAAQGKASPA